MKLIGFVVKKGIRNKKDLVSWSDELIVAHGTGGVSMLLVQSWCWWRKVEGIIIIAVETMNKIPKAFSIKYSSQVSPPLSLCSIYINHMFPCPNPSVYMWTLLTYHIFTIFSILSCWSVPNSALTYCTTCFMRYIIQYTTACCIIY